MILPSVTANPEISARPASYAWTSVPIATPRDVLAVAPDSATQLVPFPTIIFPSVTANPAISARPASYAWTSVPMARPRDVLASDSVVDPVPPFAIGRVPVTCEAKFILANVSV